MLRRYDCAPLMTFDSHQDLRAGVRDLCKTFPDAYWRDLDTRREYPEAFVAALTRAGYLAALIPEEFGGAGLGVVGGLGHSRRDQPRRRQLRRVPRADVHDGHAAAARLRRAEAEISAGDRQRRAAPAGVRRERADHGVRHDPTEDNRNPEGRELRHPRSEDLDLARRTFGPAAARRPDDADCRDQEADGWSLDSARRSSPGAGSRPHHPARSGR